MSAKTAVAEKYLKHQKARLTPKAYDREEGIVRKHLSPRFGARKAASIRKVDIQRYVTDVSAVRSAYSVQKELVVLKHLFTLAVEWEIVPANPARDVKAPKAPAGRVRYRLETHCGVVAQDERRRHPHRRAVARS
jgi:site-specific recombinase XerD